MLSERLLEFDLTEDDFCRACKIIVKSFLNGDKKYQEKYIERVVTVFDFVHFKNMMVKRNIELELEAIEGLKGMGINQISPKREEYTIFSEVATETTQRQYHDSQNGKKPSNKENKSISRNEKDFDHEIYAKASAIKSRCDNPCEKKKTSEMMNEKQQLMNEMSDSSKNWSIKSVQDSSSNSAYRNVEVSNGNESFSNTIKNDKKMKCYKRPILSPPKPPPRKFPARKKNEL